MAILSKELSTKDLVPVCRQIATAYEAGIPIATVMNSVGSQQKNPAVRRVLESIGAHLAAGDTLAEATEKQSEYLSPYFASLLGSGEQSGKLDVMLNDLAGYYEDKLALRRMIVGALTYPMILLGMCWFLGTFAMGMVKVALAGMDGSGRGIADVTQYFSDYAAFQVQALFGFALLVAIGITLSRMGLLKWVTGLVSTYLWPMSNVTRKLGMARFFRSFSLMLGSGIDTIRCIEKSAEITGNPYIEKDLLTAVPYIRRGHTLVESFGDCKMMTSLAREMLAVGEQSGNLDGQLLKAAKYHQDEANHAIKIATTVLTTAIMIGVFTLIGGIVIYFWVNLYGGLLDGLGV